MLLFVITVAMGCPKLVFRAPLPTAMLPSDPVDAPLGHRVEASLAALEPTLLPAYPDAVDPSGLRFGAWHWKASTGEGRYAPLDGPPRGVWHTLGSWRAAEDSWDPRPEDAPRSLRFTLSGGTVAVRAYGVVRLDPLAGPQLWAPETPIDAVWVSPMGRYLLVVAGDVAHSLDSVSGEVVGSRELFGASHGSLAVDAWTGAVLAPAAMDTGAPSELTQEMVLGAAYGCAETPGRVDGLLGFGCASVFRPARLRQARPAAILDASGVEQTTLPPLAPSCAESDSDTLTVWSAGRQRVFDRATGELLTDEENHRSTWLTSTRAVFLDGQVEALGGSQAPRRQMQRGRCADRAATEDLRVWTFADGTWISLTASGQARGTQTSGHLGWRDGDRFVPVLPPQLDRETPPPSTARSVLGGSLWLGLGLLGALPTRIGRRRG